MAASTTLAARTTAILTGSGTVDYCADLDMNLTEDGVVTVEITGTKGSLTDIITSFHAGSAATPTAVMATPTAAMTETITDANWTRVITLTCRARYFRAAVAGTGTATGSDAVVNYYYQAKGSTGTLANVAGVPTLSHS